MDCTWLSPADHELQTTSLCIKALVISHGSPLWSSRGPNKPRAAKHTLQADAWERQWWLLALLTAWEAHSSVLSQYCSRLINTWASFQAGRTVHCVWWATKLGFLNCENLYVKCRPLKNPSTLETSAITTQHSTGPRASMGPPPSGRRTPLPTAVRARPLSAVEERRPFGREARAPPRTPQPWGRGRPVPPPLPAKFLVKTRVTSRMGMRTVPMVTTRSKGSSSFSCRSSAASAPALSSCWPGRMSSFSFSPASSAVAMSGWLSMMCCISGGGGRPHTAGPPRGGRRAAVLRCGRLPACGDNGGSGNGGGNGSAAAPRHPRRPLPTGAVPAGRAAPRGSAAPAGSPARHEAGAPGAARWRHGGRALPRTAPRARAAERPRRCGRWRGITWRLRLPRLPGAGEQNRRLGNSGGSRKSTHAGPSCRKRVPAPPAATRPLRARGRCSVLQRAAGACMGAPVRAERRARGAAGRSGPEWMAGARRSFEVLKGTAAAAEREAAARNTLRGPGQRRGRVPAGGTARRHRACAGGAPGARGALRRAGSAEAGGGRGGGERAGAVGSSASCRAARSGGGRGRAVLVGRPGGESWRFSQADAALEVPNLVHVRIRCSRSKPFQLLAWWSSCGVSHGWRSSLRGREPAQESGGQLSALPNGNQACAFTALPGPPAAPGPGERGPLGQVGTEAHLMAMGRTRSALCPRRTRVLHRSRQRWHVDKSSRSRLLLGLFRVLIFSSAQMKTRDVLKQILLTFFPPLKDLHLSSAALREWGRDFQLCLEISFSPLTANNSVTLLVIQV